jgi:hypothetical protein
MRCRLKRKRSEFDVFGAGTITAATAVPSMQRRKVVLHNGLLKV